MAKAAYPTIGIAALVMFGIVYFIGCLRPNSGKRTTKAKLPTVTLGVKEGGGKSLA